MAQGSGRRRLWRLGPLGAQETRGTEEGGGGDAVGVLTATDDEDDGPGGASSEAALVRTAWRRSGAV